MKTLAFLIVISVMVVLFGLKAQAACSDLRYGNAADAGRIETTLQSGSVAESVAAIRAAQSSRGLQLGCAELDYELTAASSVPPTVASIRSAWAKHAESAPAAAAVYDRCPTLGRNGGAYALGGWTARAAKLDFDVSALIAIADNLEATQYRIERTPGELASWPGLYGYAQRLGDSDDSCFVQGVVGEGVARACTTAPQLCQRYRSGRFAGESFVIGDFAAALGVRDGGAGFDQGWAGLMMIEAALGAPDRSSALRYRNSAIAAANWAIDEPAVRNHNYTAKLIWLLAAAYDWTGEVRYRDALVDKLERSLLPGVLMDANADGFIDGLSGIRFANLQAPAARLPGRMWDAHNSLPWYQAMNGFALVQAYSALHARGDLTLAARVRPYLLAVITNLATEIAQGGSHSVSPSQSSFALASALWQFADAQAQPQPIWEKALWTLWNLDQGQTVGDNRTAAAAIVAARAEGRPWRSYRSRGSVAATTAPLDARISGLWYNPTRSGEGINITAISADRVFATWHTYAANPSGQSIWLVADGSFDGTRYQANAFRTEGAQFGRNFNSADVRIVPWGSLSIEFSRCNRAILSWESNDAAYGSGSLELQQLSGIADLPCEP